MLTQQDVVPYLLRRGLLSRKALVAGDLVVADLSRRNRNFAVVTGGGPCYLLKQGVGPERSATIAHEATVYQWLQARAGPELLGYLPRFHAYDPPEHVLVVEFFPEATDLREHQARCGRFSRRLAARLGTALSALHRITSDQRSNPTGGEPSSAAPWILSIHRPDPVAVWSSSRANLQLIKVIQRFEDFGDRLDELRGEWRPASVIHFDLKFDNCITMKRRASGRRTGLKLVDWELAGRGDPRWDVGSTIAQYLCFWALSVPITGESRPDAALALARYPLDRIQPAIQSFWRSYIQGLNPDPATTGRYLLGAVRYAAARLVQTALEQTQAAAELTGGAVSLLQLSLNLLRRPQEAVVWLLGLPIQGPVRS